MARLAVGPVAAAVLAVSACGTDTGGLGDRPAGDEGDVPITQAAIAAVAVDYLPPDPSSMKATYTDNTDRQGYLGADFRYGADGESDGDLVRVALSPSRRGNICQGSEGCEPLPSDDGTEMYLAWDEVEPEEDPGYVAVVLRRADEDEDVVAYTSGESITGDPREQDLTVSVEALTALVQDERLSLTTTQDVVDAGEDLEGWGGGEPDP